MATEATRAPWRSIEEWADTPAFRRWAESEFPALAAEMETRTATDRRGFLKLMAASVALAGLSGCGQRRPEHEILPYGEQPPEVVPGVPLYYATTLSLGGRAIGVLAETHEGRPTKLEGHPAHPASLGALPATAQAAILDLYDPDRSSTCLHDGQPASWDDDVLPFLKERVGRPGLAVLTSRDVSPAAARLFSKIEGAAVYAYEPLEAGAWKGGAGTEARFDLERANVILSLDCDLLDLEDDGVRNRRHFAAGRRIEKPGDSMNRLYVVEPHLTVTGMAADHRLRLRGSRVRDLAWRLAAAVAGVEAPAGLAEVDPSWVEALKGDLEAHRGRSVVVAGRRQPPVVHALAQILNEALGNEAKTVRYEDADTPAPAAVPVAFAASGLLDLVERMRKGEVSTLLMLGTNPVHDAPADLGFAALLAKVQTSLHVGLYADETARAATWHVPRAHDLERWDVALTWGDPDQVPVLSPVQPLILPLMGGRNPLEILALLAGEDETDPHSIVQSTFFALTGAKSAEGRWKRFLNTGIDVLPRAPHDSLPFAPDAAELRALDAAAESDGPELCLAADASVYDGRFANNGWLQECPDPATKLVWDNAAVMSPTTAKELGVENGEVIAIAANGATVEIPAFVLPGEADGSIKLALGYGRTAGGSLARHAGVDVYPLRTSRQPWFVPGATIEKTGRAHPLATTQEHWSIDDTKLVDEQLAKRHIVRETSLATYEKHPDFAKHTGIHESDEDIYDRPKLDGEHQWAMTVDLTQCIGCNACVVACQAENNIPIVGKDEVIRGREMHWIRVDRYFRGEDPYGDVDVQTQPMMCQHCESAPCESVCPVSATVHDEDGLNVMAYNRCIGTRYCANNCPYKVRRFNFYDYNKGTLRESDGPFDGSPEPTPFDGLSKPQIAQPPMAKLLAMQKNPDVTVRMRGVMEKCTFCTQRIQRARIDRKVEAGQSRPSKIADGTLVTACQQTCPTDAILFGDQSDPGSRVSRAQKQPRAYAVLGHLNTKPRTTYLAGLRNLNPALPPPPRLMGGGVEHADGNGEGHR